MKKLLFWCLAIIFITWFLTSYFGWYGYEKWKTRKGTNLIEESKNRGVFVKLLNYRVENFSDSLIFFKPYIERGFKYGWHSSDVTIPLNESRYPYQLSFNSGPSSQLGIFIKKDQLGKFDSSDGVWGYLKKPFLPDTIVLEIRKDKNKKAIIKLWN